jgi:hypothetical protein
MYAFISDAPMVGNVFTRALANVLTTHSQRATLCIKPTNGATIPNLARDSESSCSLTLNVGPLQYGQYREIIVPFEMPSDPGAPFLDVTLEYGDPVQRISLEADEREVDGGALSVEVAMLRAQFVDTCAALLKQKPPPCAGGAEPLMRALVQRFESSDAAGDERVAAMYADIVGRMSKALDGADRFKRWGSHYIRGLLRAHELQQCTKCVKVLLSKCFLLLHTVRIESRLILQFCAALPMPVFKFTVARCFLNCVLLETVYFERCPHHRLSFRFARCARNQLRMLRWIRT